jgi:dipeptidyl aminopeptidase/acylaminoacyl peptidase
MSLSRKALPLLCLMALFALGNLRSHGEAKRSFTVADDIRLTYFGDPFLDKAEPIVFSPDGRYFVVHTEQGRLDINRPESSLRVYKIEDVKAFLLHPERKVAPPPVWTFSRATYKDGPVITKLRWLRDSSGFAFLATSETGHDQLFLAELPTKTVRPLTPNDEEVTGFDIRDRDRYVYTVLSSAMEEKIAAESKAVSVVATDRRIFSLLSPAMALKWHDLSELWAVIGKKRIRVEDKSDHKPLAIHWRGQMALVLSPDGLSVLTALTVPTVPASWETLYPPPFRSDPHHINSGSQDPYSFDGWFDVSRYAVVKLETGVIHLLPLGPLGYEADWIGFPYTDWSKDGTRIAVTDTFLDRGVADPDAVPIRPCAAVVDLKENHANCIEPVSGNKVNGDHEEGFRLVTGMAFAPQDKDRVVLKYTYPGDVPGSMAYTRSSDGSWSAEKSRQALTLPDQPIRLSIRQSVNDPPVLIATDNESRQSRALWNPNPWLKDVELGEVTVYHWKDATGRALLGGLYKPPHFIPGQRYPLVIQTHGFSPDDFVPSGIYPTGFAARELAAAGFVVLQVRGCPIRQNPEEGPCQVAAYEAAVKQLVADGLADPDRIGIVGFSRTCYYALEALTTSTVHFEAASITDGVDMGYLQYLMETKEQISDADSVIGAPPFGAGLQDWVERSPEFHMDKVTTPLLVVGVGEGGVLSEWEPYATLSHQNKPVDLLLLKAGSHPLTNPAQRLVSQGSTVDWMCFWLKGEEDPDPAKKEQYERWRRLRDPQGRNQSSKMKGFLANNAY